MVININEGVLFKKKDNKPKVRKFDVLTKEEFDTCLGIIKSYINKYSLIKSTTIFSGSGVQSTYQSYKDSGNSDACVAISDYSELSEKDQDKYQDQLDKCTEGIENKFSKLSFKVEFEYVGSLDEYTFHICSRK